MGSLRQRRLPLHSLTQLVAADQDRLRRLLDLGFVVLIEVGEVDALHVGRQARAIHKLHQHSGGQEQHEVTLVVRDRIEQCLRCTVVHALEALGFGEIHYLGNLLKHVGLRTARVVAGVRAWPADDPRTLDAGQERVIVRKRPARHNQQRLVVRRETRINAAQRAGVGVRVGSRPVADIADGLAGVGVDKLIPGFDIDRIGQLRLCYGSGQQ